MDRVELARLVPVAVSEHWGLHCEQIDPVCGGMNSAVVAVTIAGRRYAAKWVPMSEGSALQAGAAAADHLATHGMASGPPLRTAAGALVGECDGGALALLSWVEGSPLTGATESEQRSIGHALARAHDAGQVSRRTGAFFASEIADPDDTALDVEPWVRDAVHDAVNRYAALPLLTWGTLHTDPAPEAFLDDGDRVGLIDWTGSCSGPLLYDLASASMYVGGVSRAGSLVGAYAEAAVVPKDEIRCHLDLFAQLRWAVQAWYFARRLAHDDRTGIDGPDDNVKGLHDARDALAGPSPGRTD